VVSRSMNCVRGWCTVNRSAQVERRQHLRVVGEQMLVLNEDEPEAT
jgi:hypothetical protein